MIVEIQRLLLNDFHTKRCIEFSPPVTKPSAKIHAVGAGPCRRSIDFDLVELVEIPVTEANHTISYLVRSKSSIYLFI